VHLNPIRIFLTFIYGLIGGILFFVLHLPLPWILGPAFAMMLLNGFRPQQAEWPRLFSDAGVLIVAFLLGQTITLGAVTSMSGDLPWMIMAAALWLLVCFYVGVIFAKISRIDQASGILGCVPGGLMQMVLIAGDIKGANQGTVAIIQTARLVVVLYTVPFLATLFSSPAVSEVLTMNQELAVDSSAGAWPSIYGYLALPLVILSAWIARRFRMPGGEFIGPVLFVSALTIAGCDWPSIPSPLLAAAQLLLGIYIGIRVQPRIFITNKRLGPLAIVTSMLLVSVTAVISWILSKLTNDSIVTWFLALAPGGLTEVAVTAIVLNADVAKVTAFQIFRLFFVLLLAPLMLKMLMSKK
jgi:membrane AbrB-like protein